MERIAFLIDATGERIDCLINPQTLVARRLAGVRQSALPGAAIGTGADDALLYTGGGRTEIVLDLLFDVDLLEPGKRPDDVRRLTSRLWQLAENDAGRLALVRLVWGKTWNLPGVVVSVAERLDAIGPSGAPRRSWLRLKLVRTPEENDDTLQPTKQSAVRATGDGSGGGVRFDQLATESFGDPSRWRELAEHNDIADPLSVRAGTVLAVPS